MNQAFAAFYDRYHQKNRPFTKILGDNNFTYYLIFQAIRNHLPSLVNKTILDAGCGVGPLSLYLASKGAKSVTGVDISQRAIKIAKQAKQAVGLDTVTFKRSDLLDTTGQYDIVININVLEHVPNDSEIVAHLFSLLKNSGYLFLCIPSQDNFLVNAGWLATSDQQEGHLRRYTPETVKKLLNSALKPDSYDLKVLIEQQGPIRTLLYTTRLGFLIRFIRGPLVWLFHQLDGLLGKWFGTTDITVIVQKQ